MIVYPQLNADRIRGLITDVLDLLTNHSAVEVIYSCSMHQAQTLSLYVCACITWRRERTIQHTCTYVDS